MNAIVILLGCVIPLTTPPIEKKSKNGIANRPKLYYNFKYNEGQISSIGFSY